MKIRKAAAAFSAAVVLMCSALSSLPAAAYNTKTGFCNYEYLNVRSAPGIENDLINKLDFGDSVTILKNTTDKNGSLWYEVSYWGGTGYVSAEYITLDDVAVADDDDFESQLDEQGFPESYRVYLRQLHRDHPTWIFTAQHLGIDWDTAVAEECVLGRNLVHAEALDSWKSMEKGAYDFNTGTWYGLDGTWVAASQGIIKYYLDPRNFLSEDYIFMFENLAYNPSYQTIDGVESILSDTFMNGSYTCPDTGETYDYAQTFMDAAEISGVSPYHLATRCRNEQGVSGAPQSLGTTPGYEGYFNFFDVQAFATSYMTAAQMGCKYASTYNDTYMLPWTNQYRSIVGGSIFLGNGYITKDQDTLYLQKFDMTDGGNGYYCHQYMTCVFGQANEAKNLFKAYSDDILSSTMEFKIPVYNNMPETLCPRPEEATDSNDYLDNLTITGVSLDQRFDKYSNSYTATVQSGTQGITVQAMPAGNSSSVSGTGYYPLYEGKNEIEITCTSASGSSRTYYLTVTKPSSGWITQFNDEDMDINDDGTVDIVDPLMIIGHISGNDILTNDLSYQRSDVDTNGMIDIVDPLIIIRRINAM